MNPRKKLNKTRNRRTARATAKLLGTAERPRLAVNRSNRFIRVQLINDETGTTIAAASSMGAGKGPKSAHAFAVGEIIAKKAAEKGVTSVVFDRRSYRFHGRVKQVAEGAKKEGLKI